MSLNTIHSALNLKQNTPTYEIGIYTSEFASSIIAYMKRARKFCMFDLYSDDYCVSKIGHTISKMPDNPYRKIDIHNKYVILCCSDNEKSPMFATLKTYIDAALLCDNIGVINGKTLNLQTTEITDRVDEIIRILDRL